MNVNTSYVSSGATAAEAPSILQGQLETHATSISMLANAIDSLERKLQSFMRPDTIEPGPAPAAQLTAVAPVPSAIVQEVQKLTTHIEALVWRVTRTRERLET